MSRFDKFRYFMTFLSVFNDFFSYVLFGFGQNVILCLYQKLVTVFHGIDAIMGVLLYRSLCINYLL